MPTPFLSRFADAMPLEPLPPIRMEPTTQTSEVFVNGVWTNGSASPALGRATKTGVGTETVDYR